MEHLEEEVPRLLTDWLLYKAQHENIEERLRESEGKSLCCSRWDVSNCKGPLFTPRIAYRRKKKENPRRIVWGNHYCEEEGNYGPKFTKACGASHINNAISRKEKDPGSFTLPCFINDFCFDNTLVDLGASVSVMPLSTYLNLGLGELVHTRLIVELTDRTVKYPKGIAENVLVGIGKFTFPVDFIILDMPEDIRVPLILERPFYFAVLENMDAYRDEGMGDVIFGEPFIREADIKAKRFEGMITLYKGDDEVTYQMVRSHPRFKHHTNEQCNKIRPLLKVNEKDVMHGVSHAYQKLKGFYKGVLNLGPDYIRNAKTEKWLTRGHISVHELE
ncbi:homeodomain-like protein [Tanacetum coccineum]